jgi:deoxycytidylate deaminase
MRHQVLATGYTGRAAGLPHCSESTGFNFVYANGIDKSKPLTGQHTGEVLTYDNACAGARSKSGVSLDACEAIHAEQNALLQCPNVYAIETCYVTVSPCVTCIKLLLNTSCHRVVFRAPYAHDEASSRLWLGAGREWVGAV